LNLFLPLFTTNYETGTNDTIIIRTIVVI